MTPNEIVHNAMGGEVWHDYTDGYCCGEEIMNADQLSFHSNPDYSHPEHIGKVYAWMREEKKWSAFIVWYCERYKMKLDSFDTDKVYFLCFVMASPDNIIKHISEWITEG